MNIREIEGRFCAHMHAPRKVMTMHHTSEKNENRKEEITQVIMPDRHAKRT